MRVFFFFTGRTDNILISLTIKIAIMYNLDFKDLQKKNVRIGIRLSTLEKKELDEFCEKNSISISNLTRYALNQVINENTK
jgi:hypothetical protein